MVKSILNKWVSQNNELWNIKVLDPSCGSGNYTQIIIEHLLFLFLDKYKTKTREEILKHILNKCVYSWDINEDALKICKERMFHLFGLELKNLTCCDTLCSTDSFDIIVGNPPYGDLLTKEEKQALKDSYDNIALSFIDWSLKHIKPGGEICLIVPHTFTRAKGYNQWRKDCYEKKSIYKVVDVGNPFYDIKLEEVIFFLNNSINCFIESSSFKDSRYHQAINIEDFYNKNFDYKMIIYWDDFYQKLKDKKESYPFSGRRGHNLNKKHLNKNNVLGSKWFILGKNINKNKLVNIKNYDCYISKEKLKKNFEIKSPILAITQFGTNLKAAIIDSSCYPSNGVVLVEHKGLTIEEALNYLNNPLINTYLKRYIFNNADLTVHIDGIYLEEIPYVINIDLLNIF